MELVNEKYQFQEVFDLYLLYLLLIGYISYMNLLGYTRIVKINSFLSVCFRHFLD